MAARISALALVLPDCDAAIAFHVGRPGFRLTEDSTRAANAGWRSSRPAVARGSFLPAPIPRFSRKPSATRPGIGGGPSPETDEFARDHAAMLAARVAFEAHPRHEPYGTVAVWRDPFGNRRDLIQPAATPFR